MDSQSIIQIELYLRNIPYYYKKKVSDFLVKKKLWTNDEELLKVIK